jgi:16S rRNA processing protein RimM
VAQATEELIIVGKVSSVYGVKGWVKLYSFTEPMSNLLEYSQLYIKRDGQWQSISIVEGRQHGKSLVAALADVDERDQAKALAGSELAVARSELPDLPEDEFYWHQLEGLQVLTDIEGVQQLLGVVDQMMATGANDVMMVHPCEASIDQQERLLPFVLGVYVKSVDLDAGMILVDWDPEF